MGKIRIKTLGDEEKEKKQKQKDKARREGKKISKQKEKEVEEKPTEKDVVSQEIEVEEKKQENKKVVVKKAGRMRSKRYLKARSFVDKTKSYTLTQAIELIKKTSLVKYDGSVELHINMLEKGIRGTVTLPHGTGKQIKVAVVNDAVLKNIESGKIDFDVLISHPSFMPKLAKYAKTLGPKGLMPNPKNGTISEKPEEAAKKYAGTLQYKTEPDFPIIHAVIGKVSFENDKLSDNFWAFIKAVDPLKIKTVFIKSTMSPSVKVDISNK